MFKAISETLQVRIIVTQNPECSIFTIFSETYMFIENHSRTQPARLEVLNDYFTPARVFQQKRISIAISIVS